MFVDYFTNKITTIRDDLAGCMKYLPEHPVEFTMGGSSMLMRRMLEELLLPYRSNTVNWMLCPQLQLIR